MKILFFSHYFFPEGNAPASRTFEHCKIWARQGHEVTVITCAPNVPNGIVYKGYKNKIYQKQIVDGINVIRLWTYIAANKGAFKRILNYLSYLFSAVFFSIFQKRADVIIATSPQFFCGWAGAIASRLKNIPFILEIRDIWPESIKAVNAIQNKKLIGFLEWLARKMYKSADHIVTAGEGYKQKLLQRGVPAKKISVIPNGIDPDIFHPREADRTLTERYRLENRFVCSYIGTIGMACGLDVVLNCASILKRQEQNNITFLLVGDGAGKNNFQKQATEQNLDNIIFTGRQDKNLIPGYLSVSDACLVHLKKTELFKTVLPSKIFEAAAMEKSVILGVEGFAAELVQKAKAGICIEPENAEQLVSAVKHLADNPQLRRSLGRAGRKYVIQYHNRNTLAGDYLNIISSVLNINHSEPLPAAAK